MRVFLRWLRRIRFVAFWALVLLALLHACAGFALEARFFDVGQGDAALVRFDDGTNMLIDAGAGDSGPSLVRELKGLGVRKIDIVVLTHPHEDHIGGFNELTRAFDIGKVWDSGYEQGSRLQQSIMRTILKEGVRFGTPKAGFSEVIGQATVAVLAPDRAWRGVGANDNSIILRIEYGAVSLLFMADAEWAERASVGAFQRSTVLKVAHHGSRNGTDATLLAQVKPEVAILSYGVGNRYGHPHKEVLRMLENASVRWYGTPEGDIVISSDGKTFGIRRGE